MNLVSRLTCTVMLVLLVACASTPTPTHGAGSTATGGTAALAASYAQDMVGKPYRFGGNTPSGFDCSGLVHYSFSRAGITLPRTTRTQLEAGEPVDDDGLRVGDLLFFDQEGRKFSHVGIYIGNRQFVHAPSSGKQVRIDDLDVDYWQRHFVAARRI